MLAAAAAAVAVLHGAVVVFVLTGSLLALRWPAILWVHVPVSLVILGLYLTDSGCPLTTLELWLRERAELPGYDGGFIGHYITEPLGFPIGATSTQVGVHLAAFLPNVVGYGLLALHHVRGGVGRRAAEPDLSPSGGDEIAAELVQQPDEVVIAPPLDDAAVDQAVHVDAAPPHGLAGGRDAGQIARVRSGRRPPGRDQIALRDHPFEGDAQIGEDGPEPLERLP